MAGRSSGHGSSRPSAPGTWAAVVSLASVRKRSQMAGQKEANLPEEARPEPDVR